MYWKSVTLGEIVQVSDIINAKCRQDHAVQNLKGLLYISLFSSKPTRSVEYQFSFSSFKQGVNKWPLTTANETKGEPQSGYLLYKQQ